MKRSLAPTPGRGFHEACRDLAPERKFVVYPGDDRWPLGDGIEVLGLGALLAEVIGRTGPQM